MHVIGLLLMLGGAFVGELLRAFTQAPDSVLLCCGVAFVMGTTLYVSAILIG